MVERIIVWNRVSEKIDEETEKHKYWFLIINESREIQNKKQLIYEKLRPIMEEKILDEGLILSDKSRLRYELFCFETTRLEFDQNRIYKGRFIRDDRLDDKIITIENYVRKWISD